MHDVMICIYNTESQNKLHFLQVVIRFKFGVFKRNKMYYKNLINYSIRMDNITILK